MNNRSVCIRCGKPRVVLSSYEEKVDKSTVTYTITGCSDPECQKIVDRGLKTEEDRRKVIKKDQEKREEERLRRKNEAKKVQLH